MNAQTTNKARRTRSSDSSVMDADYAAIIDVSELSDGNCIAIVQVKNEEGKAVAVRNTRFVKGTSTSISNIVEGKYDKLTPIYDLQGRKITVPAKGVYIQNGRKFVVKDLRDSQYEIPIMLITAKAGIEDKKLGFLLGADDYMVKPINMEEMVLRVQVLLKRAKRINERKIRIGDLVWYNKRAK